MKVLSGMAVAVVLAVGSSAVMAVGKNTAELRVTGKIIPVSCDVNLDDAVIDYGVIRSGELSDTAYNPRGEKTTGFEIACSAATKFGLAFTDNRAASKVPGILDVLGGTYPEEQNYGLGGENGNMVGGYSVAVRNLQGDGTKNLNSILSVDGGTNWQANSQGRIAQTPTLHSWALTANAPESIARLTGVLSVNAVINKADDLDLTGEVNLDGNTTLEIRYI